MQLSLSLHSSLPCLIRIPLSQKNSPTLSIHFTYSLPLDEAPSSSLLYSLLASQLSFILSIWPNYFKAFCFPFRKIGTSITCSLLHSLNYLLDLHPSNTCDLECSQLWPSFSVPSRHFTTVRPANSINSLGNPVTSYILHHRSFITSFSVVTLSFSSITPSLCPLTCLHCVSNTWTEKLPPDLQVWFWIRWLDVSQIRSPCSFKYSFTLRFSSQFFPTFTTEFQFFSSGC